MIIGFLHPHSDSRPPPTNSAFYCFPCGLKLTIAFLVSFHAFLSLCLSFYISLFLFVLSLILFCSTKAMSSRTLLRVPNHFLRVEGEHPPEFYRGCFLPISLSWLAHCTPPPLLFTLTLSQDLASVGVFPQIGCVSLRPSIFSDLYLEVRLACLVSGRFHLTFLRLTSLF